MATKVVKTLRFPNSSDSYQINAVRLGGHSYDDIIDSIDNRPLTMSVTYSELVSLRNNAELIPGMFYRITDYQCTTTQENTQATNHRFDIIVQALSESTLSENASADYHINEDGSTDGYFATGELRTVVNVEWMFSLTADRYDSDSFEFAELAYLVNNEGVTVPALHELKHNEEDNISFVDRDDAWFYIDEHVFENRVYSRWRLIEQGNSETHHTWNSFCKKYLLTNSVVNNNQFVIEDAAEIEQFYVMYDDDNSSYAGDGDSHDDAIVDADYDFTYDGHLVPVLYKTDISSFPDEPDHEEPLFYVGRYEQGGVIYDRWRKIELYNKTTEEAWEDSRRYYILTNVIVDNNEFMPGVVEHVPNITPIANIPAWELKYSLDNDETRFVWADTDNGTGVIYYMKDEWNNECPYDFKNIMFKRKISLGQEQEGYPRYDENYGVDTWLYTFTAYDKDNGTYFDASIITGRDAIDDSTQQCYGNKIKAHRSDAERGSARSWLNNIIFINYFSVNDDIYFDCSLNIFDMNCRQNTFNQSCSSNIFGSDCFQNIFGSNCYSNTFGNGCHNNTFDSDCYNNTFGDNCAHNRFQFNCFANTFSSNCRTNVFYDNCYNNTFDSDCTSNILRSRCRFHTFGIFCRNNELSALIRYTHFENGCHSIYLNKIEGSGYADNITIRSGVHGVDADNRKTLTVECNAAPVVFEAPGTTHIILD